MHRDGDAHARVGARELLEHEDVREKVRARAAVFLRDADAHEPELGELRDQLVREPMRRDPSRRRAATISASASSRVSAWIARWSARQLEVHRVGL